MDPEKLISLVQEHLPLWDMRDKQYQLRDVRRKLWTRIAKEMGCQVEEAKRKWQGLRDTFRKEYNKIVEQKSEKKRFGAGVSSWPHFNQMLFLKEVVAHRKLQEIVSPKEKKSQENLVIESAGQSNQKPSVFQDLCFTQLDEASELMRNESDVSSDSSASLSVPISQQHNLRVNASQLMQPPPTLTLKRKRNQDKNIDEPFLELEGQKIELLPQNAAFRQNSDYQFLMSLLPFLTKVPNNRKLSVRNKLQQVLIDEEDRANRPPQCCPSGHSTMEGPPSFSSPHSFQHQPQQNTDAMAGNHLSQESTKP